MHLAPRSLVDGTARVAPMLRGATRFFSTQWDAGRPVGWHVLPGASGVLGGDSPNADLGADGRPTLR